MIRFMAFILSASLSACASASDEMPPVALVAPKAVAPVVQASPLPNLPANWQDWPVASGEWVYRPDGRGSVAMFGKAGANALFVMRCDRERQRVLVSRAGAFQAGETGRMTIRASNGEQTYDVATTSTAPPYVSAELAARDPQLDVMVFSRGKFIVSIKGAADLVVPAWAEVGRVVEDCR